MTACCVQLADLPQGTRFRFPFPPCCGRVSLEGTYTVGPDGTFGDPGVWQWVAIGEETRPVEVCE